MKTNFGSVHGLRSPKVQLVNKGFTKDVLKRMADAYDEIAKLPSPKGNFNPSAASRAQQLRDILDELF